MTCLLSIYLCIILTPLRQFYVAYNILLESLQPLEHKVSGEEFHI